jgi:hypothetical protein
MAEGQQGPAASCSCFPAMITFAPAGPRDDVGQVGHRHHRRLVDQQQRAWPDLADAPLAGQVPQEHRAVLRRTDARGGEHVPRSRLRPHHPPSPAPVRSMTRPATCVHSASDRFPVTGSGPDGAMPDRFAPIPIESLGARSFSHLAGTVRDFGVPAIGGRAPSSATDLWRILLKRWTWRPVCLVSACLVRGVALAGCADAWVRRRLAVWGR